MPRNPNYPVQGEFRGARAIITNLNSIKNALDLTRLAATKTFTIDKQVKNVGIQMGLSSQRTTQLADTVTGLSNATGLGTEVTGQLVGAMTAAGLTAGDLDKSLDKTSDTFGAITKGAAQNLEMMAEMVGRHGIAASAIIRTNAQLGHMGLTLREVADDVTQWQKEFRIPGMIGQIPAAAGFAEKSLTEFGHVLNISAKQIIADTFKVGATFAKVYGTDIAQAIQKAQQNQQHFMAEAAQNRRVFLGLEDTFSGTSLALFEHGKSLAEADKMMRQAQEAPHEFAAEILRMKEAYEKSGLGETADRMMEQIRASSSEAVKEMLAHPEMIEKIRKAQEEAARERESDFGKGKATFAKMTDSLRKVGATALKTFHNLLGLGKAILGLSIADDLTKSFEGLHDWAENLNVRIKDMATSFAKWRKENPEIVAGVQKLIKFGMIAGGALGVLAGAASAAVVPFTTLKVLLTRMPILGGPITKVFGGIGRLFVTIGKKILWPISIIYGAIKAFEDFGKSIADPNLTGPEKLLKGVRAVFVGIVSAFDDLLMGIPTKIVKFFFPQMRGSLVDGVKRLFNNLQAQMNQAGSTTFENVFSNIMTWINSKADQIWDWMKGKLDGWKEFAGQMGKNIGRALGALARWAWDGIKWLFNPKNWKAGWDRIVNWFNGSGGPALGGSIKNIFWGIIDTAHEFVGAMADEILGNFGSSWAELSATIKDVGDWFKDWADWITKVGILPISVAWLSVKETVLGAVAKLMTGISEGWDKIKIYVAEAAGSIIEVSIGPLIKAYAKLSWAIARSKYALGGSDADLIKAKQAYDGLMQSADATAESLGRAARAQIARSSIDVSGLTRDAAAAKREAEAARANYSNALAAGLRDYEAGASERSKRARERRQQAQRTGAGSRERRRVERLNAQTLGNWANQMRGGFTGRTEALIAVLHKYMGQATSAGNTRGAGQIKQKIDVFKEALDQFHIMNDPDKMIRLMQQLEGFAGKTVLGEAKASEAYKTEIPTQRPELINVEEAVRKAMNKAVPGTAPEPPAPEAPAAPTQGAMAPSGAGGRQEVVLRLAPGAREALRVESESADVLST